MTSIPRADEPNLADEPGLAHAFQVVLVSLLASSLAVSAFTLFPRWPLIPTYPRGRRVMPDRARVQLFRPRKASHVACTVGHRLYSPSRSRKV